jgi:hypothetical protein
VRSRDAHRQHRAADHGDEEAGRDAFDRAAGLDQGHTDDAVATVRKGGVAAGDPPAFGVAEHVQAAQCEGIDHLVQPGDEVLNGVNRSSLHGSAAGPEGVRGIDDTIDTQVVEDRVPAERRTGGGVHHEQGRSPACSGASNARRAERRDEVELLVRYGPLPLENAVVDLLVLDPMLLGLEPPDPAGHRRSSRDAPRSAHVPCWYDRTMRLGTLVPGAAARSGHRTRARAEDG